MLELTLLARSWAGGNDPLDPREPAGYDRRADAANKRKGHMSISSWWIDFDATEPDYSDVLEVKPFPNQVRAPVQP